MEINPKKLLSDKSPAIRDHATSLLIAQGRLQRGPYRGRKPNLELARRHLGALHDLLSGRPCECRMHHQ